QGLSTLGFECTLEEVDLEDITKNQINTIIACTAVDPGVKKPQTKTQTNQQPNISQISASSFHGTASKCLEGIYEDLNVYRVELENFSDQKVLATIDEMMKVSFS
ncbi:IL12A protein, partial [Halcyon senegalensis]|nr:IL12A protein [Halcyon senegalensis]